jgi:hypothetical protein
MKKLILKLIAVSAIIALPASAIIYDCIECGQMPPGGAGLEPPVSFFPNGDDDTTDDTRPPSGPGIYDPLGECEAEHEGQSPC